MTAKSPSRRHCTAAPIIAANATKKNGRKKERIGTVAEPRHSDAWSPEAPSDPSAIAGRGLGLNWAII